MRLTCTVSNLQTSILRMILTALFEKTSFYIVQHVVAVRVRVLLQPNVKIMSWLDRMNLPGEWVRSAACALQVVDAPIVLTRILIVQLRDRKRACRSRS